MNLLLSCNNEETCNCQQLQLINGIYYSTEPGQELALEIGQYINSKKTLDSLLFVQPNNVFIALDSLDFYEKKKDTFNMVMQYVKMLRDQELPERKHEVMLQFGSIFTDTTIKSPSLPVKTIYDCAQQLIPDKSATANFLLYDALNNCMDAQTYNSITEKVYIKNFPIGSADSVMAFKVNQGLGKFFQYYQMKDMSDKYYTAADKFLDYKHQEDNEWILRSTLVFCIYYFGHGQNEYVDNAIRDYENRFKNFPELLCELYYILGNYCRKSDQYNRAMEYYSKAIYGTKSKYIKLMCYSGISWVDEKNGEQYMLKQMDLEKAIQDERKQHFESEKEVYYSVTSLTEKTKKLKVLLKKSNIEAHQASLEVYTGVCTNNKGEVVHKFESGILIEKK